MIISNFNKIFVCSYEICDLLSMMWTKTFAKRRRKKKNAERSKTTKTTKHTHMANANNRKKLCSMQRMLNRGIVVVLYQWMNHLSKRIMHKWDSYATMIKQDSWCWEKNSNKIKMYGLHWISIKTTGIVKQISVNQNISNCLFMLKMNEKLKWIVSCCMEMKA